MVNKPIPLSHHVATLSTKLAADDYYVKLLREKKKAYKGSIYVKIPDDIVAKGEVASEISPFVIISLENSSV